MTWAVVIGGHVLLLALLSRIDRQPVPGKGADLELYFVELSPALEKQQTEDRAPRRSSAVGSLKSPTPTSPTTAPAVTPAPRTIDWFGEAQEVAREMAAKGAEPGPRAFGEHPTSPYRKCTPRQSSFEWDPEPDNFGIAGLLPFVRLGERCIAGLGFFGCGIGKLPEPNGNLFDDMKDPDRPKSSVPDADGCEP